MGRNCCVCGDEAVFVIDGSHYCGSHGSQRKDQKLADLESPKPTTVRGWLETMPEPIRTKALSQCLRPDKLASSQAHAVADFMDWAKSIEGRFFWFGAYHYISGRKSENLTHELEGYNAAKAAYEAQKPTPTPVYTSSETHALSFKEGQAVLTELEQSPQNVVGGEPQKDYRVVYISIPISEYEDLKAKAEILDRMDAIMKGGSNG